MRNGNAVQNSALRPRACSRDQCANNPIRPERKNKSIAADTDCPTAMPAAFRADASNQGSARFIDLPRVSGNSDGSRCELSHDIAGSAAGVRAVSPGQLVGHYRIASILGSGGMGEVYRATDTRLGRTVALKVLAAREASEPDRLRRLEGEAR